MFKKILWVILVLMLSFVTKTEVFAIWNTFIPVEKAFSDINKDYKYYYELQTLYYKWIIEPEADGKFNPDKLLKRDEFVAIAEETSCKKCIVPNVNIEFFDKYKEKPFFDVWLNNKYFYCISDAKSDEFVLGYKPWDSCKDWNQKDWEIPFCLNNNITLEEALAVIMRMWWIMTTKQADIITSGIEKWQKYPDLALDLKAKLSNWKANSFYPYFKKALVYEVIDYDANWNKKIYKLIEKKGFNLRPNNLITKQDFLKMAFIALKANSCLDDTDNTKAIQIKVYDKSCSKIKEAKWLCKDSDLKDPDNTFDFWEETEWVCELWIDDVKWYVWRFYNLNTWSQIIKYWKFIDNYNFLIAWKYRVYLRVSDKCWDTWEVYVTINIPWDTDDDEKTLSVIIKANPLRWNSILTAQLKWIVTWGISPFRYIWDFADGSFWDRKDLRHVFTQEWVYEVKLTVIDKDDDVAEATVTIDVLSDKCSIDSDWDWINDCDDKCSNIVWTKENDWCPVFLPPLDDPSNSVWECIRRQENKSFIFWNVSCNSCPCTKSIDFRATIRECDTIIPAITSPTEKDIYSRWKVFQIKN